MAGCSKAVDEDELKRWAEEGRSASWVERTYAEKYGIEVCRQTTASWLRRYRTFSRSAFTLPWSRPTSAKETRASRRLRYASRITLGEEVTPEQRREVAKLVTLLRPTTNAGFDEIIRRRATELVVDYDRDSGKFVYVPRRAGIDLDWHKDPFRDDKGNLRHPQELLDAGVRSDLVTDMLLGRS